MKHYQHLAVKVEDIQRGDEIDLGEGWREVEERYVRENPPYVVAYFLDEALPSVHSMRYPKGFVLSIRRPQEAEKVNIEEVNVGDRVLNLGGLDLGEGLEVVRAQRSIIAGNQHVEFENHVLLHGDGPYVPWISLPLKTPVTLIRGVQTS